MIYVELVYSRADKQLVQMNLALADLSTIEQALNQSEIYSLYPETLDLSVGIFSKTVDKSTVLKDGDRLEIYRALTLDPKEKRKKKSRLRKT